MTDWIDDLRNRTRTASDVITRKEELRLHNAAIIRAKAPEFWKATVDSIRRYSAKLAEEFPAEQGWHSSIVDTPTGGIRCFSGGHLPNKAIDLQLNLAGLCINTQEGMRQDRVNNFVEGAYYAVEFSVGEVEQLKISFKGKVHESPDTLAEHFIRYVCDIRQ